jgi:hypothetical protein
MQGFLGFAANFALAASVLAAHQEGNFTGNVLKQPSTLLDDFDFPSAAISKISRTLTTISC